MNEAAEQTELPHGWTLTRPEPYRNGGWEVSAIRDGGYIVRMGAGATPEDAIQEAIKQAWNEVLLCAAVEA